jgi:hypothetical protein
MPKRKNSFGQLMKAKNAPEQEHGSARPATAPVDKTVAKRGNPAYKQFSAYLPADLYRRLKVRLFESDKDLSEAMAEAVELWMRQ